ncbi:MAG TPA: ATP-binding protein [Rhizomicrobium sp.]|nr:ATP-binding protein [Rhizomicrobium sp.]
MSANRAVTELERPGISQIFAVLPMPVLLVGQDLRVLAVNPAAEQFFAVGAGLITRQRLDELVPFGSPILQLIAQAQERDASVGERDVDLATPKGGERTADVVVTPAGDGDGNVVVTLHERSLAQRLDRQLLHRGAVRSLHGMAAVLAHEIKNPLAGIRGAAQLLEEAVQPADRSLTQLICDETDRIRELIDRMESFGDRRAFTRMPVNIHEVLGRVRQVAQTSFARHVNFIEVFDPSLPFVLGDKDQLIQVFLNLVRNASDAVPESGGEITLTTGYRPGMRVGAGTSGARLSVPLEVTVRDNGSGVPADLLPYIFDPFVTTKPRGSGLGLALVAKIIGDHGGVVECDSSAGRTVFRVLLPKAEDGG